MKTRIFSYSKHDRLNKWCFEECQHVACYTKTYCNGSNFLISLYLLVFVIVKSHV